MRKQIRNRIKKYEETNAKLYYWKDIISKRARSVDENKHRLMRV